MSPRPSSRDQLPQRTSAGATGVERTTGFRYTADGRSVARSPSASYNSSRLGTPRAEDVESVGWRSSEPGTPDTLAARILRPFDPARDTLDDYCKRLDKQVEALAGLAATGVGQEVDSSVIVRLKDTAQVLLIMNREAFTALDEIKWLKKQLYTYMVDHEAEAAPAQLLRTEVIKEMLQARGIDAAALHSMFRSGSAPTPSPVKGLLSWLQCDTKAKVFRCPEAPWRYRWPRLTLASRSP